MEKLASELAAKAMISRRPEMIAIDRIDSDGADAWCAPSVTSAALAFLQYTSGSTSAPRGVMLTHANLLHNSKLIQHCFEQTTESHSVIWLPPYHDMGLIGGIVQPLYTGFSATLMSPAHFLQRPIRWLEAISRYRASTSGGPNFAYELCIRKISHEERARLDLSSWCVAFNGAEPIRPDTLERFVEAFGPCGFRRESFCPCYGLGEATLIVSGGSVGDAPIIRRFQATASRDQSGSEPARVVPDDDGRPFVGCGKSLPGQQILIVDPTTLASCDLVCVGEVWINGPSVSQGYWNKPLETGRVFHASPTDGNSVDFLRTGDLGVLHDNQLFITGRLKDLIIIRGRNFYPQDIELTIERSLSILRPGCGAAFGITVKGEEQLVIVHEVERRYRNIDIEIITRQICHAIVQHYDVQPYAVVLLRPGGIPKTSSGKLQRYACREGFLNNTLSMLGTTIFDNAAAPAEIGELDPEELEAGPEEHRRALIERYVQRHVADMSQLAALQGDIERPLLALGIDSLMATNLQHRLKEGLRRRTSHT